RGTTVLAVLHDLNLASAFCDRLLLLAGGRIAAAGTPWEVLAPAQIERTYGTRALVRPDPTTGRPHVFPLPSGVGYWALGVGPEPSTQSPNTQHPTPNTQHPTVHVLAGGGSGGALLGALAERGLTVTTGAFCADDPDAEVARALGLRAITVPPFSPLEPAIEAHAAALTQADWIVVAPLSVGPLNWDHAALLVRTAQTPGRILLIDPEDASKRDHTGGRWSSLVADLMQRGSRGVVDWIEAMGVVTRH